MSAKEIPESPNEPDAWRRLKTALDTILGRRGTRIKKLYENLRQAAGAPTQAEYNTLAADLLETRQKVNELLELLHGPYK